MKALKRQLVTALSILERLGIIDFNGHCSVRLETGRFLINSGKSVRSALTPDDMVIANDDGTLAEGGSAPPAEAHIHASVYQARPGVCAVVHAHPKWSTLLSSAGLDYEVVFAQGALLHPLPCYPESHSINTAERGAAMTKALGAGAALLLRAHGSVVTGSDILEATVRAIYLEQNAERQVRAYGLGGPYVFSSAGIREAQAALSKRELMEKCWAYYAAKCAPPGN